LLNCIGDLIVGFIRPRGATPHIAFQIDGSLLIHSPAGVPLIVGHLDKHAGGNHDGIMRGFDRFEGHALR